MVRLRKLIQTRWVGRLVALLLAYLFVAEGLIASVGSGMSAAAAPGQFTFPICLSATDNGLVALPGKSDRDTSDRQSQCPFCLVAQEASIHSAAIGDTSVSLSYSEIHTTKACFGNYSGTALILNGYRTPGDPRGPPPYSV